MSDPKHTKLSATIHQLTINDRRGTKDEPVPVPTFPQIIELLMTGQCTNAQVRHWMDLHRQAMLQQRDAMNEPGYVRASRIADDVYGMCVQHAEQWGGAEHDDQHHRTDWVVFIEKQLTRVKEQTIPTREGYVRIAALCFDALNSIDRKVANEVNTQ